MELYEWTKHYIKFKDCIKKQITEMIFEDNQIVAKGKNEDKTYFIADKIKNSIDKLNNKKTTIIICLNTKENINEINNEWNLLITKPKLTIICAQPTTNERWSIHPSTHHKISENIKYGLKTLYESITSAD